MTMSKRLLVGLAAWAVVVAAAVVCVCTEEPKDIYCAGKTYLGTQFCFRDSVVLDKCGGGEYDPINQLCRNDVVQAMCGNDYYTVATQFCDVDKIYTMCNGKMYDISSYSCVGGRLFNVITVVFNANGADGVAPASMTVNARGEVGNSYDSSYHIVLPSVIGLSKDGYYFGGWFTNEAGIGTSYSSVCDISAAAGVTVTLYAKWIRLFNVTFDANGGKGTVPEKITPEKGATSFVLPDGNGLSKDGYSFGGWTEDKAGTGTVFSGGSKINFYFYDPQGYIITGKLDTSVTLYAKWNRTYTVTFDANDGSGVTWKLNPDPDSGTVIYLSGQTVKSREGYGFGGWCLDAYGERYVGGAGTSYRVVSNAMFYAKWLRKFTVTFDANGGSGMVSAVTADSGTNITLPVKTTVSKTGQYFGFWNTSDDGAGANFIAGTAYRVSGDITLFARWMADAQYLLTVLTENYYGYVGRGGRVTSSPAGIYYNSGAAVTIGPFYNAGTEVTVTAEPESDYSLYKWKETTNKDNPLKIIMDGDRTITAVFRY